jgi:hypothetical protein
MKTKHWGVPPDDDQSCTKIERQGRNHPIAPYFEDKLVVYQIFHIQEWRAIPPELEAQFSKNQG